MLFYALLQNSNAEKRNESVVGSLRFCPNLCGLQFQGILFIPFLYVLGHVHIACQPLPIHTHYVYIQAAWNPTVHTSTYTIVQSSKVQCECHKTK